MNWRGILLDVGRALVILLMLGACYSYGYWYGAHKTLDRVTSSAQAFKDRICAQQGTWL